MKSAVVFIGQSFPSGVYRNLAVMGSEMYTTKPDGVSFYYAATKDEANAGAWGIVRSTVPPEYILCKQEFREVVSEIVSLMDRYELLLIHAGGGLGQMRYFMPLKRRYGKRLRIVVITHSYRHDSWMRVPMSFLQCIVYARYVDKVVFQCPYAMRRFSLHGLLCRMGKTAIIPLGSELESLNEVSSAREFLTEDLAREVESGETFKFVYLAQLRKGKQHKWMLATLARIFARHPQARLFLCGQGGLRGAIERDVARLGLTRQVVLLGCVQRAHVPFLLRKMDCAVVPSKAETFGHAFVEPMMAGVPVVGTRVGAGEYLIQDYRTGLGFKAKNRRTFQSAVEYMLSNPRACKSMGERAARMVATLFSHKEVASAHMSMCKEVLENAAALLKR